ncbi:MAG: tRNA (adenosine(37)-N6)-dimethylallyltransferase MiaA [Sphingomonadales bacterium]
MFIAGGIELTGFEMVAYEAILIAGPTASGKTALAARLAGALSGSIINADSMQVYEGLEILAAAPSAEEMAGIPHRLFGIIGPGEPFSVGRWHDLARREIESVWQRRRLPIIVGGTGLYFKVLLEGLALIPEIPEEIRRNLRQRLDEGGPGALHLELSVADPEMAERLEPGDSQRICRALEVWHATGRSLRAWQREKGPGALSEADEKGNVLKLTMDMEREPLYARINYRFRAMLEAGALDEVRALKKRALPPEMPAMKALGVPPLLEYLSGGITIEEAAERAKTQTRQYAKRQLTWFRNQFPDWIRIDAAGQDPMADVLKRFESAE